MSNGVEFSLKELINRTSLANLVAAFLVIAGMLYAVYYQNTDFVVYLAGAGCGWLLKELKD
jgi:hypothetical protein